MCSGARVEKQPVITEFTRFQDMIMFHKRGRFGLEKGIRQSMSRKEKRLDNSLVENFFGLLKSELFYMKEYKTIEELDTYNS